jgi:hypothetical protein
VTGGSIEVVVISPDRRTVAALWRDPAGSLRCRYPSGAVGEWRAEAPVLVGSVDYVFFEHDGIRVTGSLPRGCTMAPSVELRIRLAERYLPARVELPDAAPVRLRVSAAAARLIFRRTRRGRLEQGDHVVAIEAAGGERWTFLVGVDSDGTPAAVSGYAANW